MTQPDQEQQSAKSRSQEQRTSQQRSAGAGIQDSDEDRTTIADSVVTKIASIATKEVAGVHELGGGAARAFGAIRERVPGSGGPSTGQGVSVEVGERQAAIDLVIVTEYGVPIAEVAKGIRRNVVNSVQNMTGLEVVEVSINVADVYIPGSETEESQPSRVD